MWRFDLDFLFFLFPSRFQVKDELAKLLESNQVVLVHGETGSGKTTQIGQFILDGRSDCPPRVVLALDAFFRTAPHGG